MHETEQRRRSAGQPTIGDYIDTLRNPYGRFRTLGEPEPGIDARGEIIFCAGNNAVVFPAVAHGGRVSLKCYFKARLHADPIYSYLSGVTDTLLTPVRLLRNEVYVYDIFGRGAGHDVVAAEWVEGVTLETAVARAAREDGFTFGALSEAFDDMALRLLGREWAHGDLKPENIIVRPDGTLRLIDYDAMFIPELSGRHTLEVGTPPYQHPARDQYLYDKSLDDYPIALISASLRALALDPSLYARHNRRDNIILYPDEILEGRSGAYAEILRLFAQRGDHASYNLALALQTPSPRIGNIAALLAPDRRRTGELEPYPAEGGLWGYRDGGGREVIPAVYQTAYGFTEGMAVVRIDGIWQVIDGSGAVVLDCSRYDAVKPFSDGLAAVRRDGEWGFITRDGKIAVEPRFELAGTFREGYAVIKTGGRYGFADTAGKIVVAPAYDYATGFRGGRATVSVGGRTFEIERPGR